MRESTQKLTFGALLVAIFGVLLLLNRQTGGMLEETFIFLFPIPMVAFSARYGWKDSLPVFVCTFLISIFCGIFTSAFYATAQSFIGMVYGSCLHAKRDSNRTMLLVMGLSVISNLLSGVVLASLFGISLQEDVQVMQEAMRETISRLSANMTPEQAAAIESMLQPGTLLRMLIISVIFTGILEGFIVCQLSLLILRRLRYPIQKPAPLTSYYPPRWTGFLALVLFFFYSSTLTMPQLEGKQEILRVAGQVGSLCAYMYLLCFGYLAALFLLRAYGPRSRLINALLAIVLFFILPQGVMLLGFLYISTGFHDWVVAKMMRRVGKEQKVQR
ncbi:MAG: DUF2232 domain-containing protein [Eubacteriales bacterium]|nr:DUF2232 domain-containing protein [Eubacteriales bacterium]